MHAKPKSIKHEKIVELSSLIFILRFLLAPIVGHVGDGNFHCFVVIDVTKDEEIQNAKQFSERLGR